MSIFRVRWTLAGGHVHCSLFAAKAPNMTYAKCGDFTVRQGEEFAALHAALRAEFVGTDPKMHTLRATTEGVPT